MKGKCEMKMKMENVKNDDLYNVEVEERVFKTESLEDKASTAIVAQAMVAPDFKNRDVIGKSFWCVGYVIRDVALDDGMHTGIILIDDEGQSYSTISAGVAKIVTSWKKAGLYPSWEEPLWVEYKEESKGTYRYYTVKMNPRKQYQ